MLFCLLMALFSLSAQASWEQSGDTYVWRGDKTGKIFSSQWFDDAQAGFVRIGSYTYCYKADNTLYHGFFTAGGNRYYVNGKGAVIKNAWFRLSGKKYRASSTGALFTNKIVKIGSYYYIFDKNGVMLTGKITVSQKTYYFLPSNGQMVRSAFVTIGKNKYYFKSDGTMVKSAWVNKQYFTASGAMAVSRWVNDRYVNNKGIYLTGLRKISGVYYYLSTNNGRKITNKTMIINGVKYSFDSNGKGKVVATVPRILLIAGHGQGDPGAVSKWGQEADLTRQIGSLVYSTLRSSGKVDVTFYKNGSKDYNAYEQARATLEDDSDIITGAGTAEAQAVIKRGITSNPNIPDYTLYDYVLEFHFNAVPTASADPDGDDKVLGTCILVNKYKPDLTLERNIVDNIAKTGFKVFSGGVYRYDHLFNARICQELGVPYSLLEVAFLNDGDDMKFYLENYNDIARSIANTLLSHFSK